MVHENVPENIFAVSQCHWVSSLGPSGHEELEFFDSGDETQGTTFPMKQCPLELSGPLL